MITVFVAFAGEYEVPHPLAVVDTLAKAMKAVEDSNPTYTTEVLEYDVTTGCVINEWRFGLSFENGRFNATKSWRKNDQ